MMKSFSAPTNGWNARDSLDSMKSEDAVFLDNWFPDTGKCVLRNGHTSHATILGGHVETLANYESGSTEKLIAAANGNIWDATSLGAASSLGSGFTNNRWQDFNMDGKLCLVNGADTPQQYNGSLSNLTITGSGLTATSIIFGHSFKSRSYFIMENSASFWYSSTNTLGGATTEFDLSTIGNSGGKIMFMSTWSRDAGDGMDDFAVFVMSTGDVIVYQGSNPGDAAAWALVGVYKTGNPLSRRAYIKVGGELVLMTLDGFIPMSAIIQKGQFAKGSVINDRIRNAVQNAAVNYSGNFGWDAIHYPRGNKVFFNIPIITNSDSHQYVYNTTTGAWCRYRDIQANCWALFNGNIFFGGNATVFQAENGFNDNGSDIQADAMPAFNYMGLRNSNKTFGGVMHTLASEGDLPIETRIGVNFKTPNLDFNESNFSATGSGWDDGVWDSAEWVGGDEIIERWISTLGYGYNATARLRISTSNQSVSWYSTNYLYEKGGPI